MRNHSPASAIALMLSDWLMSPYLTYHIKHRHIIDRHPPSAFSTYHNGMPSIEITLAMVFVILSKLNPFKSPAIDEIYASYMRLLGPIIAQPLAILFFFFRPILSRTTGVGL